MRELNKVLKSLVGIDYANFATVLKIGSKLTISKFKMYSKRFQFGFGIILFVLLASATLLNFKEAETVTEPAIKFYVPETENIALKKVVIDAGHGGKDPGTLGVNGVKEKHVVLDVAKMLGDQIKKNYPDIEVTFTRDEDIFIPLFERAKIANEKGADLFISIHANSAAAPGAYGTECFVLGLHKTKENLNVAKRENSTILMEDNYEMRYEGFDPNSDESYIALTLQQSIHLDQSLNMAVKVQDEFTKAGRRDRGVRQAGFIVLHQTAMPSILVEVGFVTNPNEGAALNEKPLRTKIAGALFNAFKRYRTEIEEKNKLLTAKKDEQEAPKVATPEKVESQTPPPKIIDKGVVFSVQIVSVPQPIEITPANFKGLENVKEYKANNVYKYLVGEEKSFESAVKLQRQIRESAYSDAFIVAFSNGEKISISEAFKLLENNP